MMSISIRNNNTKETTMLLIILKTLATLAVLKAFVELDS